MGFKLNIIFALFSFAFFFLSTCARTLSPPPPSNVSALFVFGDSLVDPGNNNRLLTVARSDHPPYGRDFPSGVPTGRFTNGKLTTDFMASFLGLKDIIPAYLDPNLTAGDILTGVSFASGGSGLDAMTSKLSNAIDVPTQVEFFAAAVERMGGTVGRAKARRIVENALYMIASGTNDMLYNVYILPTRRVKFSVPAYHNFLLQNLEALVKRVYGMGAKKFMVTGLPPIGCLPLQMTRKSINSGRHFRRRLCDERQNNQSEAYNVQLQALIHTLQTSLKGSKLAYVDVYNPTAHILKNPAKYGFEETLRGCCGSGLVEVGPLCNSRGAVCTHPSKYVFWDAAHPSQSTYYILAQMYQKNVLPHFVS